MSIEADQELAGREPELPALGLALDPSVIADRLRTKRPDLGIQMAEAVYVRYKPETSCLVSYRFDTSEGPLLGYAKTVRRGSERKIEKMLIKGGLVVDTNLAINLFPADLGLQALKHLTGEPEPLLDRLGVLAGQDISLRTLSYKPERRYVAAAESGDGPQLVIRAYTEHDYAAAQNAATAFCTNEVFAVAALAGKNNRNRALAMGWAPGRSLSRHMADEPASTGITVGRALRLLHRQQPAAPLPGDGRQQIVRRVTETAAAAGQLLPEGAEKLSLMSSDVIKELRRWPQHQVPVHGDFTADQVLIGRSDDRIGIIDWDRAAYGDAAWDLGCFLADLECRVLAGLLDRATADRWAEAFLAGYVYEHTRETIQVATAAALVSRSTDPFRGRKPDWDTEMRAIIQRAGEVAGW